jgi:hypothetical protein
MTFSLASLHPFPLAAVGAILLWVAPPASSGPASPTVAPAPVPTPAAAASPAFPAAWIGHWKGDATSDTGVGEPMRFTMELKIAATDQPNRFQWTVIYDGSTGRQVRAYELVVKDAARGEYAIDEKNSIVLDARLLNGTLYSHFLVEGTRIATRERLEGDGTAEGPRIEVEMIVTRDAEATSTGKADGVPEVLSWMPRSIQRATLRRVPAAPPAAPAAEQPKP